MSDSFLFNSHKPGAKDSDTESGIPDAPTPISSAGTPTQKYGNASGEFDLKKELRRKVKSRKDLSQPAGKTPNKLEDVSQPQYQEGPLATGGSQEDNATDRYFGSFSIESKRNVMDLLDSHPTFGSKGNVRMNRIGNNTREVMPNDPTKTVDNGGHIIYQNQPQASQTSYNNGTKNN
jgi:hypothetical protein